MSQDLLSNLQAVISQLLSDGAETKPTWASVLDTAVSLSDRLSHSFDLDWNQIDHMSIQLWNRTVLFKTKGSLDSLSLTKLRQIAFHMVSAINDSSNTEVSLKKQLTTVQRLQCLVIERGNNEPKVLSANQDKREVESIMLRIFCLDAELKFAKGERDEAFSTFIKAQDVLSNLPGEASTLSILCYNFGVDCFHSEFYDQAVRWLRSSYDLGKEGLQVDNQGQARTLRLLANCYMKSKEDGWQEKALNAISLANSPLHSSYLSIAANSLCNFELLVWTGLTLLKHPEAVGLYVSIQLHLMAEEDEESICVVLKKMVDHPDCDLDVCLNTLQLLKTFRKSQPAFGLRHEMIKKYQMNPKFGLLLVTMLDLLLRDSSHNLAMAKTFADECVTAHISGQRLDAMTKKQFHILLWNKAAHYFQEDKFEEAVSWYTYSLSLYPSVTQHESNLAKLHRNIATCYLNGRNYDKAFESIERAVQCDSSCPQTHFIMYKIALNTDNIEQAKVALQNLLDCISSHKDEQSGNIICLTAYLAMEKEKPELAIPALESIINHGGCEDRTFTALKCLLRLKVSQLEDNGTDLKILLINLQSAYNKLLVMRDNGSFGTAQLQEEASWFMKISWNLAIQSENDPSIMKGFFVLCSQFLSMCVTDISNHNKYQNCLVMANAACLQLARIEQDKEIQMNLLEEVLQHIEEYKLADNQAQNSLWAHGPLQTSSSSDILMLMYEFEALSKLNHPRAESILERALTLHKSDPNIFHTLAALASDPPSKNINLSMRALKVAIRIHLHTENPNYEKCSMDVRSLIELCLKSNETEAMSYFKETLEMIDQKAKDLYPEIELLWLMTKSWNQGLQYFNSNKFTLAEQWCSLSMRVLKHLPSAREHYEEQMMSLYGELMSCLDRERKQIVVEE